MMLGMTLRSPPTTVAPKRQHACSPKTRLDDSVGVGWGPRAGMSPSSQVTLMLLVWELDFKNHGSREKYSGLLYKSSQKREGTEIRSGKTMQGIWKPGF